MIKNGKGNIKVGRRGEGDRREMGMLVRGEKRSARAIRGKAQRRTER